MTTKPSTRPFADISKDIKLAAQVIAQSATISQDISVESCEDFNADQRLPTLLGELKAMKEADKLPTHRHNLTPVLSACLAPLYEERSAITGFLREARADTLYERVRELCVDMGYDVPCDNAPATSNYAPELTS